MSGIFHGICNFFGVSQDVLDVGKKHSGLRKATAFERCFSFIPSSTHYFVNEKGLKRLAAKITTVQEMQPGKDKIEEEKKLTRAKVVVHSLEKQSGSLPAPTIDLVQKIGIQLLSNKVSQYSLEDLHPSDLLSYADHLMDELNQACETGNLCDIKDCVGLLIKVDAKHHEELCKEERFADAGFRAFVTEIFNYEPEFNNNYRPAHYPGSSLLVYASKYVPNLYKWYGKELQLLPDRLKNMDPTMDIMTRLNVLERIHQILLLPDSETLNLIPQNLKEQIGSLVEQEGWKLIKEAASKQIWLNVFDLANLNQCLSNFRTNIVPNLDSKEFCSRLIEHVPELQKMNSSFLTRIADNLEGNYSFGVPINDLGRYAIYKDILARAGLDVPVVDPSQIQMFQGKYDNAISRIITNTFVRLARLDGSEIEEAFQLHKQMNEILGSSSYSIHMMLETIVKSVAEIQKKRNLPSLQTENLAAKSSEDLIRMLPLKEEEKAELIQKWGVGSSS